MELVTAIPDSITCRNKGCNAIYHAQCAKLSRSKLAIILETPNVRWYCNTCCDVPENIPTIATVDVSKQLSSIQESLAKLSDASFNKSNWPSVLDSTKSTKRRRIAEPDSPVAKIPPASTTFVMGSVEPSEVLQVVEPRRLLVASMLHPSTECDQLGTFLKEKLLIPADSSEVRIHKLIPAGTNLASLDYISFKVSVPGPRFDELMSSTFWPKGVRVREFEHRPRKPRNAAVFLPSPKTAATGATDLGDQTE